MGGHNASWQPGIFAFDFAPLVMTFNQVLQRGVPASSCIGVVHPIFKAGDRDDPGNS